MTDQKGKLVLYSGSSGVGKGTILKKLMELDENVCLSVSDTTATISTARPFSSSETCSTRARPYFSRLRLRALCR